MAAINKAFVPDPDEDFKESSSSASLPPSMNLKVVCHVDQSGAIDETRARKLPQILAALPGKMIRPVGSDWVLLGPFAFYIDVRIYNIYHGQPFSVPLFWALTWDGARPFSRS